MSNKTSKLNINKDTKLYKVIENENGDLEYVYKVDNNGKKTNEKIPLIITDNGKVRDLILNDVKYEEKYFNEVSITLNGSEFPSGYTKDYNNIDECNGIPLIGAGTKNDIQGLIKSLKGNNINFVDEHYIYNTTKNKWNKVILFKDKNYLTINADGEGGNINLRKKIDFPNGFYTTNVCKTLELFDFINIFYFLYSYQYGKEKENFDYSRKANNDNLKCIIILIPTPLEDITSLELQLSIAKLIEDTFKEIERKIETLNSMDMLLLEEEKVFLNEVFSEEENTKQEILYKVIENENGDLEYVYKVDNNGNKTNEKIPLIITDNEKIRNLILNDIKYENKKILTTKLWLKQFNKILKTKEIKDSNILINELIKNLKNEDLEEYCCIQRMGHTPTDDYFETKNENTIKWFNIKTLNKNNEKYIIDIDYIEDNIIFNNIITSVKDIPITYNDILVSFKLTIGLTKLYKSYEKSSCNEAIDILTVFKGYNSNYISCLIGNEYIINAGNNSMQGSTLNDELKQNINIKIPKSINNHLISITSLELQLSITKLIEDRILIINNKRKNINTMIILLDTMKNKILNNIFN